MANISRLKSRV